MNPEPELELVTAHTLERATRADLLEWTPRNNEYPRAASPSTLRARGWRPQPDNPNRWTPPKSWDDQRPHTRLDATRADNLARVARDLRRVERELDAVLDEAHTAITDGITAPLELVPLLNAARVAFEHYDRLRAIPTWGTIRAAAAELTAATARLGMTLAAHFHDPTRRTQ